MLGPMVEPLVLPMHDARQELALGRRAVGELVGADHTGYGGEILEQPPEELPGRGPISAARCQDIEDVAVLGDGPPQVMVHAVAADGDRVQMPFIARAWALTPQHVGVGLAECAMPPAHRRVGHGYAALGEQPLHVAVAQGEAEAVPHGMTNDRGREAVALIAGGWQRLLHTPSTASLSSPTANQLPRQYPSSCPPDWDA